LMQCFVLPFMAVL